MKFSLPLILAFVFTFNGIALADEFLGVPLADGEIINRTKKRLEIRSDKPHDEVLNFYKKALEDMKDIKYRDWTDSIYIEDDGSREWHSITISKRHGDEPTDIVIVKDNWTWIIGTLILRFIAVFVVLMVLYVGMSISGKMMVSWLSRKNQEKA